MEYRLDDPIHRRLDGLEERGRDVLAAAGRRAVRRHAVRIAVWTAVASALLMLVAALLVPVDAPLVILPAVVLPATVFAIVYGMGSARVRIERGTALAWLDGTLVLKDRAATAAEFVGDARRDGYREAALREAEPWLEGAAATPLPVPADRPGRGGLALPLAGAALLLAAALAIGHDRRSAGFDTGRTLVTRAPIRQIAAALGLGFAGEDATLAGQAAARQRAATAATAAAAGGAAGQPPTAASMAGSGTVGSGTAGGAGHDAAHGRDGRAPDSGASGQSAPGSAGAGAAGGAAARGASSTAATAQPGQLPEAERASDPRAAADAQPTAAESRATPPRGSAGSATATPALAGSAPPPAARDAGSKGGQQGSGSRSRSPGQQSGGPGNGNGNGEQGSNRGSGQDGVKRSRGVSALMLAVPMEDRVAGTINAGSVSTSTRDARPRAGRPGVVVAESRGTGQPQAGRILHRTRTAQEDRLLETYFRRPGVDR